MFWSLAPHAKVNRDGGFDFYRLPIQKKWLVTPLLDRLDRGGREQRVPTNDLQVLNVPVFTNNRRQYYNTLNARLLCQGRISGLNLGRLGPRFASGNTSSTHPSAPVQM